jgi:hypothetical protein
MDAVRGWLVVLGLGLVSATARAQVDAGRDAADAATTGDAGTGAPGDADSATQGSCNLSTRFDGDEQCILPPASGFQLHYGPPSYDDTSVAPYLRPPGDETIQCLFRKSPNAQELVSNEFHFRARPGLFEASLWRLPVARPDSVFPEDCGALAGGVALVSARQTLSDVTFGGAPENAGLAWSFAPATQLALKIHTINVSASELLEESWLNVVASDPSTVTQQMQGLSLHGLGDDVPPASKIAHAFGCAAPGELRVLQIVGFVSAAVEELKVQVRRADGSREPIYDSFDWHEPIALRYDSVTTNPTPDAASMRSGGLTGVLNLHAGDSLEWECTIANVTSQALPYGSDRIYEAVVCDVSGIIVRSDGTGWTCQDDRRTPDAGTGAAGSSGAGGRPSIPDAGRTSGGAGGTGRGGQTATGGAVVAPVPDGGGDVSARAVSSDGGCNCRVSTSVERDPWNLAAALSTLLGLSARRAGRRRGARQ